MNSPSVADSLEFEALPPKQREMIERLYGGPPGGGASNDDMVRAFLAGYEAARDEISFTNCSQHEARRAVAALRRPA